jgi:hypothetical protein
MTPWADQWAYLSQVHKIFVEVVEHLVTEASRKGGTINIPLSLSDQSSGEDPWILPILHKVELLVTATLPASVSLIYSNLVYVAKEGLPSELLGRIIRLAAFQNPEFHRAQMARLPTYGKRG